MIALEARATNQTQGDVRSVTDEVIAHRSNDRYYLNSPWGILTSEDRMMQAYRVAEWAIRTNRSNVTRCVGRFLVSSSVLPRIEGTPLADHLEVAIPTELTINIDGENHMGWMVMFARNASSRRVLEPRGKMTSKIIRDANYPHPVPLERLHNLNRQGYSFMDRIDPARTEELYTLWGETFGWTREGIFARHLSIEEQAVQFRREKSLWFSGLVDQSGRLVAAALGERLDMYVGHGYERLPIVEITEWRRSDTADQRGFMAGAVAYLNAQILTDLEGLVPRPLIFAETNFMSRAHRVGFATGMEVPPFSVSDIPVSQILEQNVVVGDDHEPAGLRDFTMMYISPHAMKYLYPYRACRDFVNRARGLV